MVATNNEKGQMQNTGKTTPIFIPRILANGATHQRKHSFELKEKEIKPNLSTITNGILPKVKVASTPIHITVTNVDIHDNDNSTETIVHGFESNTQKETDTNICISKIKGFLKKRRLSENELQTISCKNLEDNKTPNSEVNVQIEKESNNEDLKSDLQISKSKNQNKVKFDADAVSNNI